MLKAMIIGFVGNEAEKKQHNGKELIEFQLAHTDKYKDQNGVQTQKTTWIKCTKWCTDGKTGVADYIKKGDQIYVEGIPSSNAFTTKAGEMRSSLNLNVTHIELLNNKRDNANEVAKEPDSQKDETQVMSKEDKTEKTETKELTQEEINDLPF